MSDLTTLNPQVLDAITVNQKATMSPGALTRSGAGKTYQAVAQTAAIAIQDATDNLRNVSLISTTTIGVALAKSLAQPAKASEYTGTIKTAQDVIKSAAENLKTVGSNSADVLKSISAITSGTAK